MITITDKRECCGCTACESVCSVHNAIAMQPDNQGFLYPVVDTQKCVDCGLCNKVCPFQSATSEFYSQPRIYGARLKELTSLNKSQSGGAFQALAKHFIANGGVVYGVALSENLEVVHCRVSNIDELPKLYGSKYVQSHLEGIFTSVLADLKNGLSVLFSGVGCQVAGLMNLCKVRRVSTDKLLAVDLICYGVPSPQYWTDYLGSVRKIYKSPISTYRFRNKDMFGWKNSQSTFTLTDGRKIVPMRNFYNTLLFRRSCSVCPFTSFKRTSDITIGDFWGIENVNPDWAADDRGVSLILLHSAKGESAFIDISGEMEYFKTTEEECRQPQLTHPNPIHPLKDEWERSYCERGFEASVRKFDIILEPTAMKMLHLRVKSMVKRLISIFK